MVNWSAITTPQDLLGIPNTNTGGWFWLSMLYMIWFILMFILSAFGIERAIISSSMVCLIVGMLLSYMNLIAWQWCLFFVGVMIFMFLYIMWARRE